MLGYYVGMQDKRRKHHRIDLDVVVNCDRTYSAHSKDLSEGGMCLVFDEELENGRMLDLRFALPSDADEIHVFARVQWARPAGDGQFVTGVSFWGIEEADRERLAAFVKNVAV